MGNKKTSESRLIAQRKYDMAHRENYVSMNLKLNINTEADIIAQLNKQSNKQGYIKNLVRLDINRDCY